MPAKILGGAAEVYFKPTTGQLILRKRGINTDSEAWKENVVPRINMFVDKMKGNNIAKVCGDKVQGLPPGERWKRFKACLRTEGRAHWK